MNDKITVCLGKGCFEIERKLKERCDIPIFHDDQHGTAVICSAAIINALKSTMGKKLEGLVRWFSAVQVRQALQLRSS